MKVNIFVNTRSGGKFTGSMPHSSVTGDPVRGPESPEDELINAVDESTMTPEKLVATRFLAFLATRNMTMDILKQLPKAEQLRIKAQFIEE